MFFKAKKHSKIQKEKKTQKRRKKLKTQKITVKLQRKSCKMVKLYLFEPNGPNSLPSSTNKTPFSACPCNLMNLIIALFSGQAYSDSFHIYEIYVTKGN